MKDLALSKKTQSGMILGRTGVAGTPQHLISATSVGVMLISRISLVAARYGYFEDAAKKRVENILSLDHVDPL